MAKGDPRTGGGSGYFPAIYQSAMAQSAGDYDSVMNQYKSLGDKAGSTPSQRLNYSPISPQFTEFQPGSDNKYLKDFAETGGYSDEDIGNIRARAISPIRSIYDSANKNLLRQKNLQGGYSPNLGAVQAKMARESSNLIGEHTTNANADIARMVQGGKLAGATALAPLEAQEAARRQHVSDTNANISNSANIFNAQMPLQYGQFNASQDDNDFNRILETIKGQQSTYGTTPAIASTFGNQVLNAANTVSGFPPVKKGGMSVNPIMNPNYGYDPSFSHIRASSGTRGFY